MDTVILVILILLLLVLPVVMVRTLSRARRDRDTEKCSCRSRSLCIIAIGFGYLCICTSLVWNTIFWTKHMNQVSEPLRQKFQYAAGRGLALDYDDGGTPDEIIEERDALSQKEKLIGIMVNWYADTDSVTFSGVYLHTSWNIVILINSVLFIAVMMSIFTKRT